VLTVRDFFSVYNLSLFSMVCNPCVHWKGGKGHQQTACFNSKTTNERALCPISHAINVVQVNGKQQGGEGAPLFHTKKWLDSRLFIPIQQAVCIHQHYRIDSMWIGIWKVVPHFASGN